MFVSLAASEMLPPPKRQRPDRWVWRLSAARYFRTIQRVGIGFVGHDACTAAGARHSTLCAARSSLLDAAGVPAHCPATPNVPSGVNLAREETYGQMLIRGFRGSMQVVTMRRPNDPGIQPSRAVRAR